MSQILDTLQVLATGILEGATPQWLGKGRGFESPPVKNAVGDYTLTLGDFVRLSSTPAGVVLNLGEVFEFGVIGTAGRIVSVEKVSPSQIRVRTRDAADALADTTLSITIRHIPQS